jgi:hypothetical protein
MYLVIIQDDQKSVACVDPLGTVNDSLGDLCWHLAPISVSAVVQAVIVGG